jgi:hypothetical protein
MKIMKDMKLTGVRTRDRLSVALPAFGRPARWAGRRSPASSSPEGFLMQAVFFMSFVVHGSSSCPSW